MQIFSTFSTDLDENTKLVLNRGSKIIELLKQNNYSPIDLNDQFILIFAGLNGYLDNIPLAKIKSVEDFILKQCSMYEFFDSTLKNIDDINEQLSDSLVDVLGLYKDLYENE